MGVITAAVFYVVFTFHTASGLLLLTLTKAL